MSLWVCAEHGLFGPSSHCGVCGKPGTHYHEPEAKEMSMTGPITLTTSEHPEYAEINYGIPKNKIRDAFIECMDLVLGEWGNAPEHLFDLYNEVKEERDVEKENIEVMKNEELKNILRGNKNEY